MVKTSKTSSSATSADTTTPATPAVTVAAVSDDVASKQMKKLPKPKSAAVSTPVESVVVSTPTPTNIVVAGESSVTAVPVVTAAVPDTSALLGMYADYSN